MKRLARILAAFIAAIVLAVVLAGLTYQPAREAPSSLGGKTIDVLGARIRYQQWGTGPDVLLIHGSPGSLEDWSSVVEMLARTHRVTAYDRPGHGYSDARPGFATYGKQADVALGLIDALHLEHVVVVGHSYGGATALAVAARKSPAVRSVVVVDSTVYPKGESPTLLFRALALPVIGVGLSRMLGPAVGEKKIRSGIDEAFRGAIPADDFYALRVSIWMQPRANQILADERVHMDPALSELGASYSSIAIPVAIVGQAEDPVRRPQLERLHAEIHGSTLELVPAVGHYVQFQKPDVVIAAIEAASAR